MGEVRTGVDRCHPERSEVSGGMRESSTYRMQAARGVLVLVFNESTSGY